MKLIEKSTGRVVKEYGHTDSDIIEAVMEARKHHRTHVLLTDDGAHVNLHSHGGRSNVPRWNKGPSM